MLTIVAFTPVVAGFGTMLAIITKTKARPATPLFWILAWSTFPILGSTGMANKLFGFSNNPWYPFTVMIFLPIVISWILAILFALLASYLLDRKLSL